MAKGGLRVGAGRKPLGAAMTLLTGGRNRRFGGRKALTRELAPPEPVDRPSDLPQEQAAVWAELAPHATEARTLVPATVQAFRDLCEAIVVKRALLARIETDGLTYIKVTVDGTGTEHTEIKAHPLLAQHRGMMQRVEAGMARFRLAPMGKEILPTAEPENPFDAFEAAGSGGLVPQSRHL